MNEWVSSFLWLLLGSFVFLLAWLVQLWYLMFFLFYHIALFCNVVLLSLTRLFFSTERQKGMDPNGRGYGEELGGVEGRETIIRLHCMRKETTFNKRGEEIKMSTQGENAFMLSWLSLPSCPSEAQTQGMVSPTISNSSHLNEQNQGQFPVDLGASLSLRH